MRIKLLLYFHCHHCKEKCKGNLLKQSQSSANFLVSFPFSPCLPGSPRDPLTPGFPLSPVSPCVLLAPCIPGCPGSP